jgi:hypothetical protein
MGWFVYGVIVGALGMRLALLPKSIGWPLWVLGAITLLLGALTAQHVSASLKEREPRAAWRGLLLMGIPTLVLGLIVLGAA